MEKLKGTAIVKAVEATNLKPDVHGNYPYYLTVVAGFIPSIRWINGVFAASMGLTSDGTYILSFEEDPERETEEYGKAFNWIKLSKDLEEDYEKLSSYQNNPLMPQFKGAGYIEVNTEIRERRKNESLSPSEKAAKESESQDNLTDDDEDEG